MRSAMKKHCFFSSKISSYFFSDEICIHGISTYDMGASHEFLFLLKFFYSVLIIYILPLHKHDTACLNLAYGGTDCILDS